MWAAIAGAVLGAAGSATNFITQAKEARKRSAALDKRERDNTNWYNREYNKVGTEAATAQRAISIMKDAQKARMARASGAAAVTGASGETVAAEKAAANKAISDTMSAIAAQDDARRERVDAQYRAERRHIEDQRDNLSTIRMQNMAAAAGQAMNTAGTIIANSDELLGKNSREATNQIMGRSAEDDGNTPGLDSDSGYGNTGVKPISTKKMNSTMINPGYNYIQNVINNR